MDPIDVKSMKRFIRRKIEYDDLTKKKVVPKRQWAYAIYQSSITTDRFDGELKHEMKVSFVFIYGSDRCKIYEEIY